MARFASPDTAGLHRLALEISNPRDAVSRLDADERDAVGITDAIDPKQSLGSSVIGGGAQMMSIINESGFYKLVLTSRKPAAKRFTKWVTAEVLPALRRHGRYELHSDEAMREISTDRLSELLNSENELLRSKVPAARAKRKAQVSLSDDERAEILRLVSAGLSLSKIARLTGRSTATISMLRSGFRVINGGL